MRWFIVKDGSKNRQTFTNPYIGDARTDPDTIAIIVDLSECVVTIPPGHTRKADHEEGVCVLEGVHYMLHPTISINLFITGPGMLSP
jgi:hypothetical protein